MLRSAGQQCVYVVHLCVIVIIIAVAAARGSGHLVDRRASGAFETVTPGNVAFLTHADVCLCSVRTQATWGTSRTSRTSWRRRPSGRCTCRSSWRPAAPGPTSRLGRCRCVWSDDQVALAHRWCLSFSRATGLPFGWVREARQHERFMHNGTGSAATHHPSWSISCAKLRMYYCTLVIAAASACKTSIVWEAAGHVCGNHWHAPRPGPHASM